MDHDKDYVRQGDLFKVHTNAAEGFFSVFKRGMVGTYQHCGEQRLQRYLAEFDFRANYRAKLGFDDNQRVAIALQGITVKRLTHRRPHQAGNDTADGGGVYSLAKGSRWRCHAPQASVLGQEGVAISVSRHVSPPSVDFHNL